MYVETAARETTLYVLSTFRALDAPFAPSASYTRL